MMVTAAMFRCHQHRDLKRLLLGAQHTARGQVDHRDPLWGPFGSALWGFTKYSIALGPV